MCLKMEGTGRTRYVLEDFTPFHISQFATPRHIEYWALTFMILAFVCWQHSRLTVLACSAFACPVPNAVHSNSTLDFCCDCSASRTVSDAVRLSSTGKVR